MITEYDLLGLATKTIDLNGIATFNYYDERGRLTKATYPEIGDVDYFYDATGLKTKVTDALDHSNGTVLHARPRAKRSTAHWRT